jgi:hypothetical protein
MVVVKMEDRNMLMNESVKIMIDYPGNSQIKGIY